ncbi:MAG: formyltransferase family protein [Candidatus Omnitrophota bacterium]
MKIVVLTTQTTHHTYFVRELQRSFPVSAVLVETEALQPSFATHHPFEDERERYERKVFFGGKSIALAGLVASKTVRCVNNREAIRWLKRTKPEVTIVFGTGRIRPEVIRLCGRNVLNLHGGDPREYRGVDSHLWAIYHKDFNALKVTLHKVNAALDDGEIVGQGKIRIAPGMKLSEVRRRNTEICVRLVKQALRQISRNGVVPSTRQKKKGRYYSFMPSCLKGICVRHFDDYVRSKR